MNLRLKVSWLGRKQEPVGSGSTLVIHDNCRCAYRPLTPEEEQYFAPIIARARAILYAYLAGKMGWMHKV